MNQTELKNLRRNEGNICFEKSATSSMMWSRNEHLVTAANEHAYTLNIRAPREQRGGTMGPRSLRWKNVMPVPESYQGFNLNLAKPLGHHCRHTETFLAQRAGGPCHERTRHKLQGTLYVR